jgi:transposase
VKVLITAGEASDKTVAHDLMLGLPPAKALVADKGYDSKPLVDFIASLGGQAHIPTRRNLKVQRYVEPALYRQRNLVERFFCSLKQFRRAATRFDKLARNFLATIALACTRLWLRRVESRP